MQFTGTSSVLLPQVSSFGFLLSGVKVSNTGVVNFSFYDTGTGVFTFGFSGGLISTNKTISTYNTIDKSYISGYYQSGVLTYMVNGIVNQQTTGFTKLNKFTVQSTGSTVNADVSFYANQINYIVSFPPTYKYFDTITGTIVSDTAFPVNQPKLISYNSNRNLLSGNYPTGFSTTSGSTSIVLSDIDTSLFEYQNNFGINLNTTFGDIGDNFSSYRSGIINQSVVSFSASTGNVYAETSLFDGSWSGNQFIYSDNPVTYNLGFNYSNFTYNGIPNNSSLSIKFQPLNPAQGSGYQAQYITGFNLTASGNYATPPTAQFSQYYYVTGLQNSLQSFLFSTGCTGLTVTFSGGGPISGASGKMFLKPVRLSGIYGTGVSNYMVVSGYSGMSSGNGYQSPPTFILSTGGGCYSVPDASGSQTPQFQFARGSGAVYAQAAGLTGLVLTSYDGTGYHVTGIQVTNIGFGYSTGYPPNISFQRATGDSFSGNASGTFLYKTTGLYQFDQFWDIAYNLGSGLVNLNDYTGYFSGSMNVYGNGNVGIQIGCSSLDNTAAVSGLLILSFLAGSTTITQQQTIYQTRTFDLNTGALMPFSSPTISVIPLPDFNYILSNDPLDLAFQEVYDGGTVNNIISF